MITGTAKFHLLQNKANEKLLAIINMFQTTDQVMAITNKQIFESKSLAEYMEKYP